MITGQASRLPPHESRTRKGQGRIGGIDRAGTSRSREIREGTRGFSWRPRMRRTMQEVCFGALLSSHQGAAREHDAMTISIDCQDNAPSQRLLTRCHSRGCVSDRLICRGGTDQLGLVGAHAVKRHGLVGILLGSLRKATERICSIRGRFRPLKRGQRSKWYIASGSKKFRGDRGVHVREVVAAQHRARRSWRGGGH